MPDLLQVTPPVTPKNYNLPAKAIVQTDEIFDLVDLSKVLKPSDRSEQPTQQDAAFDETGGNIRRLPMLIAKDPSLSASSLKALLSSELLAQLKENGNTALLDKLNALASEIMLNPEEVLGDLTSQRKEATLFTGGLFDLLRGMAAQTTNPEIKNALLAFLKSTVNASSGQEILDSLSASLKYLSEQLAGSKALSARLMALSAQFADANAAKDFAAKDFASLRSRALALLGEAGDSLLITDKLKSMLPLVTHNLSRYSDNAAGMKESFSKLLELLSNKDLKSALSDALKNYAQEARLPPSVREALLPGGLPDAARLQAMAEELARQAASQAVDAALLAVRLAEIPAENGTRSLREILSQVLPQGALGDLSRLLEGFEGNKDLNALLDHLSKILNAVESMEVKVPLAQKLNEALNHLARSENIAYTPPSSMENLTAFLAKNINDAALKSLSGFTPSEMVQSLLTAPGVFTPLLHYLVPVQVEDTRGFGELWVDNNAGGGEAEKDEGGCHLFLSFSVEHIGDFELELFTKNRDLTVALFCPPQLTKSFTGLRDSIGKIISANGYSPKNTTIEGLKQKRNLVDVFPRIRERRMGLNVTV